MQKIILGLLLVVAFSACQKVKKCGGSLEKAFVVNNFNAIKGGENFSFTIHQGPAFSIKAIGCESDLNDLQLSVNSGRMLVVGYSINKTNRLQVDFDITLPALRRVVLESTSTATLSGFSRQADDLWLVLSGTAKCTANDLPSLLKAELSGASSLTVKGNSNALYADVAGASVLNAYGASFTNGEVYTSGKSKAQVAVQSNLLASASGDSRIYYKGNPTATIEQEGTARVIHE